MFTLSPETIDRAALQKRLEDGSAGGCVTFEGWVRNENEGRDVRQLEYEGYEAVAAKAGQQVPDVPNASTASGISRSATWPCGSA